MTQFANRSFPVSASELPCLRGEVIVGANLHARLRDHFAAAENGRGSSRLYDALPQIRRASGNEPLEMHQVLLDKRNVVAIFRNSHFPANSIPAIKRCRAAVSLSRKKEKKTRCGQFRNFNLGTFILSQFDSEFLW